VTAGHRTAAISTPQQVKRIAPSEVDFADSNHARNKQRSLSVF
jgi:hypothetical protein